MKDGLKILILEDNASDAELMELELKKAGISFTSMVAGTRNSFETALADFRPDLILSDYTLPAYNGRIALEFVKETSPGTPVIMVTGTIGEETAVELLKAGAKDYVLKDRLARLPSAVERVLAEAENAKVRRESERLLRESEERFRNAMDHAPIGIFIAALDGCLLEVNQSMCNLLGYRRDKLLGLTFMDITQPDDHEITRDNVRKLLDGEIGSYKIEKRYVRKDGQPVYVQVTASLLRDSSGAPLNFIGQVEDITKRRRNQEEIRHLAHYDTLTCLPNRRLLLDRLNQALAQAKRHRRSMAVMFLDLDYFKEINDTLGHDAGDELLKVVAGRLENCVRSGVTVSRLGGDEFIIVLAEISCREDTALVAKKILELLNNPILIQDHELKITTSIGIAIHPVGCKDDAAELMRKADVAMYATKRSGRNGFRFYSDSAGVIGEAADVPG